MNDMASGKVTRYEDGWQYRGRDTARKQFRKVGFRTKKDAQEALDKLLVDMRDHGFTPDRKLTTGEWLDAWLAIVKESARETTYTGYVETVDNRLKPYLGSIPLAKLSEDDIRAAYRKLVNAGKATTTIRGAHSRLKRALTVAVNEKKITRNPAKNVVPPAGKPQRKTKVWSFDELQTFMSYMETQRDAAMWAVWCTTGLRRGEVCGLRWPKVDLTRGEAVIDWQRTLTSEGKIAEGPVKTDAGERTVPLDPRVVSSLRIWRASQAEVRLTQGSEWRGGDYVFTTRRHDPYFPGSFGDRLTNLCERAGVPRLTPHELRHTFGTRAAEAGMQIELLSKMLGHSKIEVTMNIYVHPSTEETRAGALKVTDVMFG